MRSVTQTLKVEGHNSLVRDVSSNAIISTNDAEYLAYKKRRDIELKKSKAIEDQLAEINNLKNEMLEIKELLYQIISNRG